MTFKRVLLLIILAEAFIALLAISTYGVTLEGLQATTRFSGRFSLIIFSFIFILPIYDRQKLFSILSAKPFHVFAIAHGIHLIELLSFVYLSDANLIPLRLAGGFVAYVLIFVMPAIHQSFEKGNFNQKKYALSETVYAYYVWFIFFMSYLPRLQGKLPNVGGSYYEFVVLMVWVCLLMLVRLTLQFSSRKSSTIKT
jgi:hypothetical protein